MLTSRMDYRWIMVISPLVGIHMVILQTVPLHLASSICHLYWVCKENPGRLFHNAYSYICKIERTFASWRARAHPWRVIHPVCQVPWFLKSKLDGWDLVLNHLKYEFVILANLDHFNSMFNWHSIFLLLYLGLRSWIQTQDWFGGCRHTYSQEPLQAVSEAESKARFWLWQLYKKTLHPDID